MATRSPILRLALVAGLAVLLSGCYAHGARHQYSYYGTDSQYGGSHQPAHGHGYHKHKQHKDGHHRHRRHDRVRAQEPERSPEGAQRTERRRQGRRNSDAQAVQRDRRRAAAREGDGHRRAANDRGRGDRWMLGPTARNEGPRPGAEGAAH
jgi:hypothetical protein